MHNIKSIIKHVHSKLKYHKNVAGYEIQLIPSYHGGGILAAILVKVTTKENGSFTIILPRKQPVRAIQNMVSLLNDL